MNYTDLINRAIKNNEIEDLLCGKNNYEVEMSKFTSDSFPTDINSVLVNCFYKQYDKIEQVNELLEQTLEHMLKGTACDVYIAILYFDTCIFQEEIKKATFFINKQTLSKNIKEAIDKNKEELSQYIIFENGIKKNNPMKNIENFNKYYEKNYKFNII